MQTNSQYWRLGGSKNREIVILVKQHLGAIMRSSVKVRGARQNNRKQHSQSQNRHLGRGR